MRKAMIAGVALMALLLSGCNDPDHKYTSNVDKAIDSCISKGGVPILSAWDGRLTDCKFPQP